MVESVIVTGLCSQLSETYGRIASLTAAIVDAFGSKCNPEIVAEYEEMRLQELEHAQRLTLELTGLIIGEQNSAENADEGSAFAEGELTDTLGDKTEDKGESDEQ